MTLLHQAAQKAVEVAGIFRTFTKSSHRFHDGQPLHLVAAELLETLAALQHQEVPREPVAPEGYELVLVPKLQPADEPDWDACIRQAEVATGLKVERHTMSIVIREVRRWLAGRNAASPSTTRQQEVGSGAQYRHKRTGGLYAVIGTAKLQTDKPLFDMAEVVAYRGEDGRVWVRAAAEFDERFERAAAPSTPENADGGPHG